MAKNTRICRQCSFYLLRGQAHALETTLKLYVYTILKAWRSKGLEKVPGPGCISVLQCLCAPVSWQVITRLRWTHIRENCFLDFTIFCLRRRPPIFSKLCHEIAMMFIWRRKILIETEYLNPDSLRAAGTAHVNKKTWTIRFQVDSWKHLKNDG